MSKRLRIFITALIASSLLVMPLRAGWATTPALSTDDTSRCHITMDNSQTVQADVAPMSDSGTAPPCCRDHCDGCDGNCDAGSPASATVAVIPAAQAPRDSTIPREVASPIASATPQPLLRPPPAFRS